MTSKSLPAYLQQILQQHVERSELNDDEELRQILSKLSKLNDSVEEVKAKIRQRKQQ